jgi:AcrR family transcriptional regulator
VAERTAAPGRPRRYDDEEEIDRLFAATLTVLRRSGGSDVTVAEILREAGVATRAFYRHFDSKDELFRALYRRDAERVAVAMEARLATASTPADALSAWIDEILAIGHEGAKARRASTLNSFNELRSEGSVTEALRALQLLMEPLVEVLEAGQADGTFAAVTDARSDARMISAVVWDAADLARPGGTKGSRAEVRERVLQFSLRAVGAAAPAS